MASRSKRQVSSLQTGETYELTYKPPGPTIEAFHLSNAFVRVIMGPFGSGKSSGCCIESFVRAMAQRPGPNRLRQTRMAVIRSTYPELRTTTMKTWLEWFPEDRFGPVSWSPPFTHVLRLQEMEMEVLFFALEREEDVKKLLSLDLTFAWINEGREIPKSIVDGVTGRIPRFPPERAGGVTWGGVMIDTNAPDEHHWIPVMAGWSDPPAWMSEEDKALLVKPSNWEFFRQPPAAFPIRNEQGRVTGFELNPKAENLQNLDASYYRNQLEGKRKSWVMIHICNELGTTLDGKPVFSNYRADLHVAPRPLEASPHLELLLSIDFGLTGALLVGQRTPVGVLQILAELHANGRGAKRFAQEALVWLRLKYPWLQGLEKLTGYVQATGDPAGDSRSPADERDIPASIWRAVGLPLALCPTNDITVRLEAVDETFGKLVEGGPSIVIDPSCQMLIAGLAGKYQYVKQKDGAGEDYEPTPRKDRWSHVQDALQYLILKFGGHRAFFERPLKVDRGQDLRLERGRSVFERRRYTFRGRPKERTW